jgi:hypothetical protein
MFGQQSYGLDTTISIDRMTLIAALTAKRSSLEEQFAEQQVVLEQELAKVLTYEDKWKDYYIELGKRLEAGKAKIKLDGEARNGDIGIKGGPQYPGKSDYRPTWLKQRMETLQRERHSILGAFDGLLDLLTMSTDAVVNVPTGQHQHLMGLRIADNRYIF